MAAGAFGFGSGTVDPGVDYETIGLSNMRGIGEERLCLSCIDEASSHGGIGRDRPSRPAPRHLRSMDDGTSSSSSAASAPSDNDDDNDGGRPVQRPRETPCSASAACCGYDVGVRWKRPRFTARDRVLTRTMAAGLALSVLAKADSAAPPSRRVGPGGVDISGGGGGGGGVGGVVTGGSSGSGRGIGGAVAQRLSALVAESSAGPATAAAVTAVPTSPARSADADADAAAAVALTGVARSAGADVAASVHVTSPSDPHACERHRRPKPSNASARDVPRRSVLWPLCWATPSASGFAVACVHLSDVWRREPGLPSDSITWVGLVALSALLYGIALVPVATAVAVPEAFLPELLPPRGVPRHSIRWWALHATRVLVMVVAWAVCATPPAIITGIGFMCVVDSDMGAVANAIERLLAGDSSGGMRDRALLWCDESGAPTSTVALVACGSVALVPSLAAAARIALDGVCGVRWHCSAGKSHPPSAHRDAEATAEARAADATVTLGLLASDPSHASVGRAAHRRRRGWGSATVSPVAYVAASVVHACSVALPSLVLLGCGFAAVFSGGVNANAGTLSLAHACVEVVAACLAIAITSIRLMEADAALFLRTKLCVTVAFPATVCAALFLGGGLSVGIVQASQTPASVAVGVISVAEALIATLLFPLLWAPALERVWRAAAVPKMLKAGMTVSEAFRPDSQVATATPAAPASAIAARASRRRSRRRRSSTYAAPRVAAGAPGASGLATDGAGSAPVSAAAANGGAEGGPVLLTATAAEVQPSATIARGRACASCALQWSPLAARVALVLAAVTVAVAPFVPCLRRVAVGHSDCTAAGTAGGWVVVMLNVGLAALVAVGMVVVVGDVWLPRLAAIEAAAKSLRRARLRPWVEEHNSATPAGSAVTGASASSTMAVASAASAASAFADAADGSRPPFTSHAHATWAKLAASPAQALRRAVQSAEASHPFLAIASAAAGAALPSAVALLAFTGALEGLSSASEHGTVWIPFVCIAIGVCVGSSVYAFGLLRASQAAAHASQAWLELTASGCNAPAPERRTTSSDEGTGARVGDGGDDADGDDGDDADNQVGVTRAVAAERRRQDVRHRAVLADARKWASSFTGVCPGGSCVPRGERGGSVCSRVRVDTALRGVVLANAGCGIACMAGALLSGV